MKAEKVVTILDACHSGGIEVRSKGKAGGTKLTLNEAYQRAFKGSAGKVVLHSCDANEKSYELDDGSQGVFSKFLVDGLLGAADANSDGVITIREAYDYANEQVVEHMKQDGRGKQTPVMSRNLVGKIPLTIDPQRKMAHQLQKQIGKAYNLIDVDNLINGPVVVGRAVTLLKKRAEGESLTSNEKRLLNYLNNLLAGKIELEIYLGADKKFGQ